MNCSFTSAAIQPWYAQNGAPWLKWLPTRLCTERAACRFCVANLRICVAKKACQTGKVAKSTTDQSLYQNGK